MAEIRVGLPALVVLALDVAFFTGFAFALTVTGVGADFTLGAVVAFAGLPVDESNARRSRNCCAAWRDCAAAASYCLARA